MDELTVDAGGLRQCLPACQQVRSLPLQHGALCRRDNFFQLLQGSGDGPSLPYMFLPGNHEARARTRGHKCCH